MKMSLVGATLRFCVWWTILLLSLGSPVSASAMAVFQSTIEARLTVSDTSKGSLQIFGLIDDDGTDPATTYGIVDPVASPGSSANAAAAIGASGFDFLTLTTSVNGSAIGTSPGLPISAFSAARAGGGFFLLNEASVPVDAIFVIDWLRSTTLAAGDAALDFVSTLSTISVFQDGMLTDVPVSVAFQTPVDPGNGDSGKFQVTRTIGPGEQFLFSMFLDDNGFAQSIAPTPVPEPGTFVVVLLGLGLIVFFRRSTLFDRKCPAGVKAA